MIRKLIEELIGNLWISLGKMVKLVLVRDLLGILCRNFSYLWLKKVEVNKAGETVTKPNYKTSFTTMCIVL